MTEQWAKLSSKQVAEYCDDEDFRAFVMGYAADDEPEIDTVMLKKLTQCYFASLGCDVKIPTEEIFKNKLFMYGTVNGIMNCLTYLPLPTYIERHRAFFIRQILNKAQPLVEK